MNSEHLAIVWGGVYGKEQWIRKTGNDCEGEGGEKEERLFGDGEAYRTHINENYWSNGHATLGPSFLREAADLISLRLKASRVPGRFGERNRLAPPTIRSSPFTIQTTSLSEKARDVLRTVNAYRADG